MVFLLGRQKLHRSGQDLKNTLYHRSVLARGREPNDDDVAMMVVRVKGVRIDATQ
jgi:hypothetical protein